MESDFSTRDALSAVATDRRRLGERMTAETRWAAPAQGLAAALLIGAPAFGIPGVFFAFAASCWFLLGVEWLFRKRSGLSISRPAGPRGITLLVLLVVLLCGFSVLSLALWALGLIAWITPLALVGGLLMTLGVVSYDHAYALEVRRAR
ncbi:hypothetical protein ACWPKO_23710 (plasmid) [Coraliomargarita sp. W4R53]